MYLALFRPTIAVALFLLALPLVVATQEIIAGAEDPKFVGGAAVQALVTLLLLGLLGLGPRRPGVCMSVLGSCAVMTFATAWIYDTTSQVLITMAVLVMFGLCLAAAVTLVDRSRDDTVSYL